MTVPRLLWIGDAAVSSGFARATHQTLDTLRHHFDVAVLGLNYMGDPHPWPYPIYPCFSGGDLYGLGRVKELIHKHDPTVIVVQNDPWNFQAYLTETGTVPVVGAVAVDGLNCRGKELNGLALAVFWTKFGEEQARIGDYTGPSAVIPLGVDLNIYKPQDSMAVRERMNLHKIFSTRGVENDVFIVGVVGRNQPRKRLDLTIEYFAEWVHSRNVEDALLWLHVAPTGEQAFGLQQLGQYYGISNQLVVPQIEMIHGITEESMSRVYNVFDVLFSTTQGEGFGLPMFESMACGTPVIAPAWSALDELLEDAAIKVPCTSTAATINAINVIGGIPDRQASLIALDDMYADKGTRQMYSERGLKLVAQNRYRWGNIGKAFNEVLQEVIASRAGAGKPVSDASEDSTVEVESTEVTRVEV